MKKVLKTLVLGTIVCAVAIVIARFVFPLPSLDGRTATSALPPSETTRLGAAIAPLAALHPGKTGIVPLITGPDAFAARILMAQAAQTSIDVQYYIWHKDLTGLLLLESLKKAADRGVRVRLLVDDNGTPDLDNEIAALNAMPNMEVRLYNPFVIRSPRLVGYLFDFFRLNRRMHNKSFTADNAASVIGGRNVGDEYFGTGPKTLFVDLDVLAVGEVVPKISADFDRYWSSASAYPAELFVTESDDALADFDKTVANAKTGQQFAEYEKIIDSSAYVEELRKGSLPLEWTDVTLVSDDPVKTLGSASQDQLMLARVIAELGAPKSSIDLISPYFVPGDEGVRQFAALKENGIAVRILTNAMETTDVAPVHAGYAKHRENLLRAGIQMFELRQQSAPASSGKAELNLIGSSSASLHAKTFAVDGKRLYVGSFNFDPRSALLNTEMGLLIESPVLAGYITSLFDNQLPRYAYQPKLEGDGLVWTETALDGAIRNHDTEPNTTAFQRALITFNGWLPVEWML